MTVLTAGPDQERPGPNPGRLLNPEKGIMMTVLTDPDQERPSQERGIMMTVVLKGPGPGPSPDRPGLKVLKV